MPVIDLTKTEIYRKAMEPVMEAHRDELAAMGYSLEKDGWVGAGLRTAVISG